MVGCGLYHSSTVAFSEAAPTSSALCRIGIYIYIQVPHEPIQDDVQRVPTSRPRDAWALEVWQAGSMERQLSKHLRLGLSGGEMGSWSSPIRWAIASWSFTWSLVCAVPRIRLTLEESDPHRQMLGTPTPLPCTTALNSFHAAKENTAFPTLWCVLPSLWEGEGPARVRSGCAGPDPQGCVSSLIDTEGWCEFMCLMLSSECFSHVSLVLGCLCHALKIHKNKHTGAYRGSHSIEHAGPEAHRLKGVTQCLQW